MHIWPEHTILVFFYERCSNELLKINNNLQECQQQARTYAAHEVAYTGVQHGNSRSFLEEELLELMNARLERPKVLNHLVVQTTQILKTTGRREN